MTSNHERLDEALPQILEKQVAHPTDSHPSTGERLAAHSGLPWWMPPYWAYTWTAVAFQ